MKQLYLLLGLIMISITVNGQRRYAADRYFKEYAYKKSGDLYQSLYDKGDKSYLVLSRLADSYYYTASYKKAEPIYAELMNNYQSIASPEHYFRYSQALKSNGKVKESDSWLLKLKDIEEDDSRVLDLEKNRDYFTDYSKNTNNFLHVHNLSINTKYSDFGGFIEGDSFYFSSTRPDANNNKIYKWNGQPYLNIYRSKQKEVKADQILDVEEVKKEEALSTKYHESNAVISKDGETMYFTRYNSNSKKGKITYLKMYKASKNYDKWEDIKELPFNGEFYSTGHPALSEDGNTLYFVSDRPGGFGETDLYSVSILEDGSYGEPTNLGSGVNTEGREMFPSISGEALYFSSDGHLGLGGLDVFESKKQGNAYVKAVNVGSPVNGSMDDFGFILDKKLKGGYFSSNREGGKGDDDIYSFRVYKCKEDIEGVIRDTSDRPLASILVQLMNKSGEPLAKQTTKEDGVYHFPDLECNKEYVVVASNPDYKSSEENATVVTTGGGDTEEDKSIALNLKMEPLITEGNTEIVINPIYFDYNLYEIREDAEYELEHIVSVLENHPSMVIKIESHTDSRGGERYNLELSDQRAKATRDYLVMRGISSTRIESAKGYGESQLLNDCGNESTCTEAEHQKNRRSYFYIVKE